MEEVVTRRNREGLDMPELSGKTKRRKGRDLNFGLNVLRTESKAEFVKSFADISADIEPKNSIERMYVADIAYHTWEIMRYWRVKTGILNNALSTALMLILSKIVLPPSSNMFIERWSASQRLSHGWLFDPETKRRVSSLLQEAGFDESAIEAEAYTMVAADLERADRMLQAAQAGRDKALRSIAKYRKSLADQLRRSSDRVLAEDQVPSIANDAEN
jgi:hypothetical protein